MLRPSGRIYFCYTTRSATDWLSRSDASCSASFQIVRFSACDSIPTARYLASLARSIVTIIVNDAAAAFSRRVENRTIHVRQKIAIPTVYSSRRRYSNAYHGIFLSIFYPFFGHLSYASYEIAWNFVSNVTSDTTIANLELEGRIWSNLEKKLQTYARWKISSILMTIGALALCRLPRSFILSSYICIGEPLQRWRLRNETNENDEKLDLVLKLSSKLRVEIKWQHRDALRENRPRSAKSEDGSPINGQSETVRT